MLLVSLLGCSDTCPSPQSRLGDVVWDAFLNPVEYTLDNPDEFPADSSPSNGEHELQFDWLNDQLFQGGVTVTMDGQAFDGKGTWSDVECGHFTLSWSGTYLGPSDPDVEAGAQAVHGFAATADLTTYDQELEGFVDWSETWKSEDGQVGTYTAAVQLHSSKASAQADGS